MSSEMKIVTTYRPPPIPVRIYDWCAVTDNYDAGDPIGWGSTEEDAIEDLKIALEETHDK